MKNTTKTIVILLLLFVVVLFAVINAQPITINFMFTKQRVPLVLIIIGSVIIGAIIALIGTISTIWKKNRAIKELNQQISDLKSTPVDETSSQEITTLEQKLKESELEISDLRHKLVSQMMSNTSDTRTTSEDGSSDDTIKG
ncbi:lipopolysaccharide assembly protein LapA domain-containing protein [Vagococcus sp. JNUCC 83]